MRDVLAYTAAGIIFLWGVFHIVPTAQVIAWLRPASRDSRLVIAQEWIAESITFWGVAALIVATTAARSSSIQWVYGIIAALLASLAVLTGLTGARTPSVWFKVCLPVLATAIALLVAASLA